MKKNKILFSLIICSFLSANEIVKTSELELFLFKVGFESLLVDVSLTSDSVSLNKKSINDLNSKVNLIMTEIYKEKKVLKFDNSSSSKDINILKKEINFLKKELSVLHYLISSNQGFKKQEVKNKIKIIDRLVKVENSSSSQLYAIVNKKNMFVKNKPSFVNSITVENLSLGDKVFLDSCNSFGWCKIKDENKYVAKYLLKFL